MKTIKRPSSAKLDRRTVILGTGAGLLSACAEKPPSRGSYRGPLADGIVVRKGERRMFLLKGNTVLSDYAIELGFAPVGHKQKEGDGKTPEGQYFIDRRNERSAFYLSLGISYPNSQDRARAVSRGESPGGDIFIHGQSRDNTQRDAPDWTAGCIAITDREMATVFQMVPIGTPIWIMA